MTLEFVKFKDYWKKVFWLSMLEKPTEHNSVYHVISWAEDQRRMYNNWETYLGELAHG